MKLYLILVWDGLEPILSGPYKNEAIREVAAQEMRDRNTDDDSIFRLTINDKGLPEIGAYSGGFFKEKE